MAKAAKMDKGQQKETLVKVLKIYEALSILAHCSNYNGSRFRCIYVISSDSYRRCGGCSVTFSSVIPGDG